MRPCLHCLQCFHAILISSGRGAGTSPPSSPPPLARGSQDHQSPAGDQVPGSVHLHPAPSVGRDWRHVSSARPGPPPGAWCRPRRGHTSGLLHGSREQSPAAVTSNQGGEGKVGGYPLLTGHEDLSRTSVFHIFVRITALVYTACRRYAKVGCLSYVRGCWPAPPRPARCGEYLYESFTF